MSTKTTTSNNGRKAKSSKPEVSKPKPSTRNPKPSTPSSSDSNNKGKSKNTSAPKPADAAPKPPRASPAKVEGQNCKLLERPLRCGAANCRHGDYCRSCNACGMTIKGFVYHCKDKNTDFHPSCTKLKKEIQINDVIFRLEKKGNSKCLRCQRKKLEGSTKEIPGWSYVSNHKGYTFHVHCLMDMAMQASSKKNQAASSSSSSSSSSSLALNNLSIPQNNSSKFKDNIGSNSLIMLEGFLKIVLPLLLGAHPAAFVVSLAAIGVKELVNLIFQD
ncbi:hypothetical protein KSS87_015054 [Heliosperma pusillum]|nr:hypothetical protein KSS87_015054 [Heliosperma pusillum]